MLIACDISVEDHCKKIVEIVLSVWGWIDIVINNAAAQFPKKKLKDLTAKQLIRTFDVNVYPDLYFGKSR
jgi:NAD(P)-dependent dehydrogenase (short-subunit alcohol dehydrogenase family)